MDRDKKTSLIIGIGYAFFTLKYTLDDFFSILAVVFIGVIYSAGFYLGMILWDCLFPAKKEETPKPDTSQVLPAEGLKAR